MATSDRLPVIQDGKNFIKEPQTAVSPSFGLISVVHFNDGRDEKYGKVGGTWLGISKDGHFAALTNYLVHIKDFKEKTKGRGFLVSNFLTGSDTPKEYCDKIYKEGDDYNGFNLITGTLWGPSDKRKMHYACNMGSESCSTPVEPGIHGLCNCELSKPWKKVKEGQQRFNSILNRVLSSSEDVKEEELVDDLITLLKDKTPHIDPATPDIGHSMEIMKLWSAINVRLYFDSGAPFGTRTHTVILVRSDGKVTFVESNLEDFEKEIWKTETTQFQMEGIGNDSNCYSSYSNI